MAHRRRRRRAPAHTRAGSTGWTLPHVDSPCPLRAPPVPTPPQEALQADGGEAPPPAEEAVAGGGGGGARGGAVPGKDGLVG